MNLPSYKIGAYNFRPAVPHDGLLAEAWNDDDPDHDWEGEQDGYWTEQDEHVNSYVLEDWIGIVFFLKMIRTGTDLEVSMQFPPRNHTNFDIRTARAMSVGFEWLLRALTNNSIDRIFFSSRNQTVIDIATKQWGFAKVDDDPISTAAGYSRFMCMLQTTAGSEAK